MCSGCMIPIQDFEGNDIAKVSKNEAIQWCCIALLTAAVALEYGRIKNLE